MDSKPAPQMTCRALLLVIAGLLATTPAQAAPLSHRAPPYVAELNRQCSGRRLQDLSPGDLELIMEDFETRLTPVQRRKIEAAIGERCLRVEAGISCGNAATLDVFRRERVLRSFVHDVCATTWTCGAYYTCTQAKP
jgi:hypothetical protein